MEYKLLMRNDEKLYNLIENEISKKFTFKNKNISKLKI